MLHPWTQGKGEDRKQTGATTLNAQRIEEWGVKGVRIKRKKEKKKKKKGPTQPELVREDKLPYP